MLKILGYLVLTLFSVIYVVSSSTRLTVKITEKKIESNSMFRSDKYRYGDLFGLSYLPGYQIPLNSNIPHLPLVKCDTKPTMDLYFICDSYLYEIADKKFYCGADNVLHVKTIAREKLYVTLNPERTNILLLEMAERNLRGILDDTSYVNNLVNKKLYNQPAQKKDSENSGLYSRLSESIFNKKINRNLESNIWDYSFFTPIKKLKAGINYKLFNVTDNDVAVSPDKKYLLFKPTIDTTLNSSSFQYVTDAEVKSIIEKLNQIYNTAKILGFKEAYLSIIPNPVSVLYPDYKGLKYNQLLTRIQNSADLKMPVVDIYTTFKNTRFPIYLRSDSHWNMDGVYLWINKFNSLLMNQSNN
jgi:hypothetical protein